mgnify:FL=1
MLPLNFPQPTKSLKSIRLHPSFMAACQNLHVDPNLRIIILLYTNFHTKQNECLLFNTKTFKILKKIVLPVPSLFYSSISKTLFGIRQKSGFSEEIKRYSFPGFRNDYNYQYHDKYNLPLGFFEEQYCLIACHSGNSEFHLLTIKELELVRAISFAPFKETFSLLVINSKKMIFIALHELGSLSVYNGENGIRMANYQNNAPFKRILGYSADTSVLIVLNEMKGMTTQEKEDDPLNFELGMFDVALERSEIVPKLMVPIQNDVASCLLEIKKGQAHVLEFFCDEVNGIDIQTGQVVSVIKLPEGMKMKNRYFFEWEKALFKLICIPHGQGDRMDVIKGFVCVYRNTIYFLN